jgi:hypothetical protein
VASGEHDHRFPLSVWQSGSGTSLRDACLRLGAPNGEEFDALIRPEEMTRPNRTGVAAPSGKA